MLRPTHGHRLVVTTDVLVEGVDFTAALSEPEDWGWKAVVANLSDLAAMGAEARWLVLALTVPDPTPVGTLERVYAGVGEACRAFEVALVGGDVVRTASGKNSEHLDWAAWNVRDLIGEQGQIQIVDTNANGTAGADLANEFDSGILPLEIRNRVVPDLRNFRSPGDEAKLAVLRPGVGPVKTKKKLKRYGSPF